MNEHPQDDPGDEVLTIEEAAPITGRRVSTLRYWRGRGEGPPSYLRAGRVVYLRREVEAWAADRNRLVPSSSSSATA